MSREFEQALDAADTCGDPVFDLFFETPWDRTAEAEGVYSEAIANVPEGITFFAFHFSAPGVSRPPDRAHYRTDEYALFNSGKIERVLAKHDVTLIGMREVRDRRRTMRAAASHYRRPCRSVLDMIRTQFALSSCLVRAV
jgi:hypothetical protein